MSRSDLYDFWLLLAKHLTDLGLPMSRASDKALDIGYGAGYRALVDDRDRITHPDGKFVEISSLSPKQYAIDLALAYHLSKTERSIMTGLRSDSTLSRYRDDKFVYLGVHRRFRLKTIDRLTLLGLIKESESTGSDVEYEISFPDNLPKRLGGIA